MKTLTSEDVPSETLFVPAPKICATWAAVTSVSSRNGASGQERNTDSNRGGPFSSGPALAAWIVALPSRSRQTGAPGKLERASGGERGWQDGWTTGVGG